MAKSVNVWDCGSTLYDSFELKSFKRQLDSAILASTRTLSMPHLPDRRVPLPPTQQQPHPQQQATSFNIPKKSSKISRSLHKLLRSVFKPNKSSGSFFPVKDQTKDGFYVVYDKSGSVLSTIPEVPTFEIAKLSPEISSSVHEGSILKIVWVPPEYGDAVACICVDGSVSLWEEVAEDAQPVQWKMCKSFKNSSKVLDIQFGISMTRLKLVAAYSDGHVKVYELLDPLELNNWQLQAEYQNVTESVPSFGKALCFSASISWNPQQGESQDSSIVVGFNSNTSELNSSKFKSETALTRYGSLIRLIKDGFQWQSWLHLEKKDDQVYAVKWAPNIGRPFEVIAVATSKGIAIWQLGLNPDQDGRLSAEKVALLSGHEGEVWQMEWDMSGMTLATTGRDGMVRLWQANLNGVWQEQAAFELTS
ncbi:protein SEH1 [Quillaja saponaria]|uniref:Protein SEH1 n=1 Tax=Quillaja saponaria TaxID=32244 RepID=A0AAD7KU73_QUISA|nr:protein SEH1 [Quillaja saponaria]